MRSAAAIIVGVAAVVVVTLVVVAATSEREQAFTLGVSPSIPLKLPPGRNLCQTPISVPPDAGFDAVAIAARSTQRRSVRLDVTVRAADAAAPARFGAVLARRVLDVDAGGPARKVTTGPVRTNRTIAVCVANRDRWQPAVVYGNTEAAARGSNAYTLGKPTGYDLSLRFERPRPRTLAGLLPAMFERAALFRAQWVGAWTYWLVALLCVFAVPLLLVRALRSAVRDSSGT
jgi:hypothetical protein